MRGLMSSTSLATATWSLSLKRWLDIIILILRRQRCLNRFKMTNAALPYKTARIAVTAVQEILDPISTIMLKIILIITIMLKIILYNELALDHIRSQ